MIWFPTAPPPAPLTEPPDHEGGDILYGGDCHSSRGIFPSAGYAKYRCMVCLVDWCQPQTEAPACWVCGETLLDKQALRRLS